MGSTTVTSTCGSTPSVTLTMSTNSSSPITAMVTRSNSPTRVTFSYSVRPLEPGVSLPVPVYSNHGTNSISSRSSGRARTSAWRRAGGLSAQAPPFYPTTTTGSVNFPAPPLPPPPPPLPRLRISRSRSPVTLNHNSLPASPTHAVASTASVELSSADQNVATLSSGTFLISFV